MNGGCPAIRGHFHLGRHSDLAVHSVNAEHAMHFHAGLPLRGDCPLNSIGPKRNLGIFLAFEHFPVHLAVAHAAATLATFGVDHDLSRKFSDGRFELQRSAFQLKTSVHGMQYIAQSELDRSVRGINLKICLLGGR